MSYDMLLGILIGLLAALFSIGLLQANRTSMFWELYSLCKHFANEYEGMSATARWKELRQIKSLVESI